MDNKITVYKIKNFLKEIGVSYTLKNKQHYIERIEKFNKILKFPWREDQKEIIYKIIENKEKYYVINGIFGCGKTTLLFGALINLIIRKTIAPEDVMFISFNICIRNEIKRKLKPFGFKGKIKVTTFDSIIYQICKLYKYPYLDLPNFDGKRRFCYEKCEKGEIKPFLIQPKLIFIDEVQDLEKNTLIIFKSFFPNTKIVFAGDVFQSIQKEPRESLLWDLLHNKNPEVERFYMKITPRVPKNILSSLQKTLIEYYPEFDKEITNWVSTNEISDATVKWNRFYSYSHIFDISKDFIEKNGENNTMILTFSSAITVKGALGDISRLRRELIQNYDLNKNHKKIEPDKLFLSTANSSKGLERDHVLVLLTFPLEKAFSNFSNDIVINLITVAITRARKSVHFYIPAYEDKFTEILKHFKDCPLPDKKKIREVKNLSDFTVQDYLDAEKCVTELIKQNIIFYDTRIELKQFIKKFDSEGLFDGEITVKRPIMPCEEERAFVGVVIENLITSTWSNKWPHAGDIESLRNHPMYFHIFKRIESNYNRYNDYIRKNKMDDISKHVKGIYMYSQIHVAMYNKVFINFPIEFIRRIEDYWKALKLKIKSIRPKNNKLKVQTNLRMPWITGISDAIFESKSIINGKEYDEINIWEIKASIDPNWKDNALTQGFLYALMCGKNWSRITLINPFRNEKCSYYFNSKNIISFRNKVYKDVLTWNLNCYLSKTYNTRNSKILDIKDCYFVNINYHYRECKNCKKHKKYIILKPCSHHLCCECVKQINKCPLCDEIIDRIFLPQVSQLTLVEMLSPTKAFVKINKYFKTELPEGKLTHQEKLSKESTESYSEKWVGSVHRRIWISGKSVKGCDDIGVFFPREIEFKEIFKYQKNPELRYSLDFDDGLVKNFSYIILLSREYKFI